VSASSDLAGDVQARERWILIGRKRDVKPGNQKYEYFCNTVDSARENHIIMMATVLATEVTGIGESPFII